MNSGRAKKIAKRVYGDLSRKGAKYFRNPETGQIIREEIRRRYQTFKKQYKETRCVVKRTVSREKKWMKKQTTK